MSEVEEQNVPVEVKPEKGRRTDVKVFIWRHRQRGVFVAVAHDEDEARQIAVEQRATWVQHRAVDAVLKPQHGEAWLFRQYG